ncbi:MAG: M23 family metallopeptidase [Acidobacteriota bacterium]|nr:M23 family metallopeptidase [Acidobacteriota bacterium]
MKRLLILAALIFAAFFIHNNWGTFSENGSEVIERSTASFGMARLYAMEPEDQIRMPIRGIKTKQIADTWQAPRSGERLHQGQDIFARRGTPVYSATEGYVLRIGESNLGGNIVSVLGKGGRVYYYAHLDKHAENLSVGDYVTPETVLGTVGTTGNAQGTPPHLHFGVYTSSGAINPLSLLNEKPPLNQP